MTLGRGRAPEAEQLRQDTSGDEVSSKPYIPQLNTSRDEKISKLYLTKLIEFLQDLKIHTCRDPTNCSVERILSRQVCLIAFYVFKGNWKLKKKDETQIGELVKELISKLSRGMQLFIAFPNDLGHGDLIARSGWQFLYDHYKTSILSPDSLGHNFSELQEAVEEWDFMLKKDGKII